MPLTFVNVKIKYTLSCGLCVAPEQWRLFIQLLIFFIIFFYSPEWRGEKVQWSGTSAWQQTSTYLQNVLASIFLRIVLPMIRKSTVLEPFLYVLPLDHPILHQIHESQTLGVSRSKCSWHLHGGRHHFDVIKEIFGMSVVIPILQMTGLRSREIDNWLSECHTGSQ